MDGRLCEECGKPIPQVRLRALPWTETCVHCSRERPLTENDIDLDGTGMRELNGMVTGDERSGGNSGGKVNWSR